MTYASIPTPRHNALLAATWLPRVLSTVYDPRFIPALSRKRARSLVERVALLLQAALLLCSSPQPLAALFCASRLGAAHGLAFLTLPVGTSFEPILQRAFS